RPTSCSSYCAVISSD
ncbi:'Cold-shock' DNA-binding domain protein, partial [Vibrio cholerae HC-55C2]